MSVVPRDTKTSLGYPDLLGCAAGPVVAIVGPTATGKTALAVELALRFGGEIVGADSRQVYRGMNIGTGKPAPGERARVPHHLIDIVAPDEEFSVALYERLAAEAIAAIHRRGRLPLLVGGSGHYVWALLKGLRPPRVPPNPELRRELYAIAEEEGGIDWLHAQLQELDPVAAARIDPRNVRRVARAIEVTRATGVPFSRAGSAEPPPYRTLLIGLTAPRDVLGRRIDERVDAMFRAGWVDEVRRLLDTGYASDLPALSSLGYQAIVQHLRGEIALDHAIEQTKRDTRRFARRQYAWFRPRDPSIRWIDITGGGVEQAAALVEEFLRSA